MAAARKYSGYQQGYVDGNTARRLHVVEVEQSSNVIREKQRVRRANKNTGYKIVLVFAIAATLLACVVYLKSEMTISRKNNAITALEKEYKAIQQKNELLAENLKKDVDLQEVFLIATEELGMIHPSADQVKYYNKENTSYMNQITSIENDVQETNHLTNIIGFISKGW